MSTDRIPSEMAMDPDDLVFLGWLWEQRQKRCGYLGGRGTTSTGVFLVTPDEQVRSTTLTQLCCSSTAEIGTRLAIKPVFRVEGGWASEIRILVPTNVNESSTSKFFFFSCQFFSSFFSWKICASTVM